MCQITIKRLSNHIERCQVQKVPSLLTEALRTVFRKTAQDTSGELLQVDWSGSPGWSTGPDHVHPRQEERFEVLSGKLGLRVGGVERVHSADGDVTQRSAASRESFRDLTAPHAKRKTPKTQNARSI